MIPYNGKQFIVINATSGDSETELLQRVDKIIRFEPSDFKPDSWKVITDQGWYYIRENEMTRIASKLP